MFARDEVIPAGPVVLRAAAEADAEAMVRACRDPEIVRFIPLIPLDYTRGDALAYLKHVEEARERGGSEFAMADAATGAWLGNIGLKPPVRGSMEVGYLVAPRARGRGVATAALRALAARAFAAGVPRLELLAAVENAASQRVAMAAGFRREGVLRAGEADREGPRRDLVVFGRLAEDDGERLMPYLPPLPGGELTDGVVRLTPLTAADAADYLAMTSDPSVARHSAAGVPPSLAESERRCRYTTAWWLAGERAELAIRDAASGGFAGHIQLTRVTPELGEAMVGYSLVAAFRGRGLATRAVNLLLDWAFTRTALSRVVAGTVPGNAASQKVLERAGFTREAVMRGMLPGPDGTRLDNVQWARLRA
ncbi:Protein N-acetyltransferase, RimJ/RimL family [Sinosporangium album]|uniref:Protein N-acetyltransferase, RimJ/RimL family n=1 Tax=Sinosporangium album TaxID=504805 RepID=A0A1G8I6E6_9ACTN|nr:GNAT family N-acetyltransferase [Sinosporangium album]SDI14518.1 Protein N-acetyltransferase, RimJ/RimL family [Sinosporangium album]